MAEGRFRLAMHRHYDQAHFPYPYPDDIQQVFQATTAKPLDWFFDGTLKTEKGIDFAVKGAHVETSNVSVRVKSSCDFPAPVSINAFIRDSLVESAWSLPFSKDTTLSLHNIDARVWRIGYEIPDYYGFNNR